MEKNKSDPKHFHALIKPQLQLIPPALNVETSKALLHGANKYGAWNWRSNEIEMMTYIGAMKRHIDAIIDGQDIDPDSGVNHLGHIAATCGIILDAEERRTLIDDRP
jgi:hypothetical protein